MQKYLRNIFKINVVGGQQIQLFFLQGGYLKKNIWESLQMHEKVQWKTRQR